MHNNREYSRQRRARLKDSKHCGACGKQERLIGITRCHTCSLKDFSFKHLGSKQRWAELDDLLRKQRNRCYYSGLKIYVGKNASIDHIRPSSRHPDRATNIRNLVWTDKTVNRMKTDFSFQEFIKTCKRILENFGYIVTKIKHPSN